MNGTPKDIDPASDLREEDDEQALPEPEAEAPAGTLAAGRAAIARAVKQAPSRPGVYRMVDAQGEVLYVGKAKNIKKRVTAYTRPAGHDSRIVRMISGTAAMEFVTTKTETEALLLEANLIKRLRPRFNVLLRDDKSFPFILITSDHWAPHILKHRGARTRAGHYYGPFANAGAVNRTINALQRAFLLRSCSDLFFEARTRPCLLYQIKRCAAPCTQEIDFAGYGELVREANEFLSGRSRAVQKEMAAEMDTASNALDFERAAIYRDRLAALSAITSHQGINPRTLEEADVFAVHQAGGYTCVEVFFFRTGQNWGNRAYFPRPTVRWGPAKFSAPSSRSSMTTSRRRNWCWPRTTSMSARCWPTRSRPRAAARSRSPCRNAASARNWWRTRSPMRARRWRASSPIPHRSRNCSKALTETFALPRSPRRIEVYDNSHIGGSNAVGAMVVAGPEGFRKNQYRKFNIRSTELNPGDDYGMLREVLQRRFKRLLEENPRLTADAALAAVLTGEPEEGDEQPWPDLVLIDGGQGQLSAATETLAAMGVTDVPLVAIAKGPDRDAGRETFFMAGRSPFKLPPRDPLLYFIERLRDEAHRFAIGSHRTRRKKDIREAGLQEIPGIGPTRKRALLRHFGTLKAIERASLPDLAQVPGINAETARKIYEFFHEQAAS